MQTCLQGKATGGTLTGSSVYESFSARKSRRSSATASQPLPEKHNNMTQQHTTTLLLFHCSISASWQPYHTHDPYTTTYNNVVIVRLFRVGIAAARRVLQIRYKIEPPSRPEQPPQLIGETDQPTGSEGFCKCCV